MPPKPVPAFWLVLLVAKSGVGAAAVDKTNCIFWTHTRVDIFACLRVFIITHTVIY